jgi:uncharacterized protein (DUF2147 family)
VIERRIEEERLMKRLVALVALSTIFAAGPAGAADSLAGTTWKTVDEKSGKVVSEVQLYDQGGKLFGKITRLTEPNNEQGKPKMCTKCQGDDKDKPIVGLVILKDLSLSGDRYKGGTITDPEDGKIYKSELWVEDGKLKVRGYLGIFYRTQTWLKGS